MVCGRKIFQNETLDEKDLSFSFFLSFIGVLFFFGINSHVIHKSEDYILSLEDIDSMNDFDARMLGSK